jgi:hypothetical protein
MHPKNTSSHLSSEDAASIGGVLTMLEDQALRLGAGSKIAGVWSDWADLLSGRDLPWQIPWNLPIEAVAA